MPRLPTLKPQEIPFDHPDSCNMFQPGPDKPFLATPRAIEAYQIEVLLACLWVLQDQAEFHGGLDYLQVFEAIEEEQEHIWFIEDGPGGAINALLPTDY